MDRKPLKDFDWGAGTRYDQVCFFKAQSGCSAGWWGHRAGQEVNSSESKKMIRKSWLYSLGQWQQ